MDLADYIDAKSTKQKQNENVGNEEISNTKSVGYSSEHGTEHKAVHDAEKGVAHLLQFVYPLFSSI